MAGRNFLFIPGPTNIPEAVRRAMALPMEDHRAPDMAAHVRPLLADLKRVFQTRDGQAFVFPASGTGGWEAAITNTLSPGDKVLACRLGQFSHLWIDLCQRHGLDVEVVDLAWGEATPVQRFGDILDEDSGHRIKAVLVCHNETATGVTSDVAAVRRAMDAAGHPALLMVDGVSSIASIDFRMDQWGVDLAVSGSQKGFMLPAGLAIVCASERAMEASRSARCPRCFFDFADMIRTNGDGYFPYTPAMTLLRGLRASLDLLLDEGLEQVFARHRRLAAAVRQAVWAWGLELCATDPRSYSDTVSAIRLPAGVDGGQLVRHAYERYDLSLGAGLGPLAGRVFRIGHLGDLNELMVLSAVAGAEMVLLDQGVELEPGSGVAAAIESLRGTAEPTGPRLAALAV